MTMKGAIAAALFVAASAAQANDACSSIDFGRFPVGATLSADQRAGIIAEAPAGTVHCSRDGGTCYAPDGDGTVYRWGADGRIAGKSVPVSDPARLPGWQGRIDERLAADLGKATCARFTLATDELNDAASLKSAPITTADGQSVLISIYGTGSPDAPITIETGLVR